MTAPDTVTCRGAVTALPSTPARPACALPDEVAALAQPWLQVTH